MSIRTVLTLMLVAWPAIASATLGGDVSSIESDRIRVRGALRRTVTSGPYTVHEVRSASGAVIREYVSPAGKVFGVAWQGPRMPDMRQVLGPYFDAYARAARDSQARRRGHGPMVIETPELVVHVGGHQRALAGHAYVPAFVPQGMNVGLVR